MANAVAGVGTVFQRLNPNTAVWDDIAEINSIEGPNEDRDTIDVTSLDTEGGYDEFITGFLEGGTLVLNMNFNRNGYEVMKQDFEVDLVRNYRIVLPDDEDTTLEFEGLVTEIPITMEADNQLTADVTIQVSGEITIASAGAESSVEVPSEDVSSGSYDEDLVTFLAALTEPLSVDQELRLDTLIKGIKSDLGISTMAEGFDVFYVLAGETKESSMMNLAKRAHDCEGSDESSDSYEPNWTQFYGFKSTFNHKEHLQADYRPVTNGVVYTQNSCSMGVYSPDVGVAGGSTYICGNSTYTRYNPWYNTVEYTRGGMNGGSLATFHAVDTGEGASGMHILTRTGNTIACEYNGISWVQKTINSVAPVDNTFRICMTCDDDGTVTAPSAYNGGVSVFFLGKYFTEAQCISIVNRIEAYMDDVYSGAID